MVADDTVVPDVHVRHDQVVVANQGISPALDGAPVNSGTLADDVVIAHGQSGGFAPVGEVRCRLANGTEGKKLIVAANLAGPLDDNVGVYAAVIAYFHIRANDTERANADIAAKLCRRVHHGQWIYHS